ncbi:adrenocortical dysplasia protein homolog [Xyrichtys novacula]|uniref:Adrenocortical dysplasia protein homolog n=1 Tax=Xyrichtys novacula TaxID=13765 RepID=A0AAV1F926_XYRNO|nr:adrenocortical dysplasia protein homolog [Xyrichtys novacula]
MQPWIEGLILGYDSQGGSRRSSSMLTAQIIRLGKISESQAQGSEGHAGLVFLYDGVLQIPAILTSSAWEDVQEKEELESLTSLLNSKVYIHDYQLLFHMAPELVNCRFYLTIGEMTTTGTDPVRESVFCCTTLPSVSQKICSTWKALLGQEELYSQSQRGFNLTELLGEWQHDYLQSMLEDDTKKLVTARSRSVEPQPSTSASTSPLTHTDLSNSTRWDVDRIKYKREKCFTVPINCLLTAEDGAQPPQTPLVVESSTPSGLSAAPEDRATALPRVETAESSADEVEWQLKDPALVRVDCVANENLQVHEDDNMLDDVITGLNESHNKDLSNPWDNFPSLRDTSPSTSASPESIQPQPEVSVSTRTQLSVQSSKESRQTSENNSKEFSSLTPYQKPPHLSDPSTTSTTVSPPEPDETKLTASEQESQIFEENMAKTVERKPRKAKRKKSEPSVEAETFSVEEEEEKQHVSGSPPSWLFHSTNNSVLEKSSSHQQDQTDGTTLRTSSTVHSDGKPFSYSYQVSGKNIQDMSLLKIPDSLLTWAVKYLVTPKQTDNSINTSRNSSEMFSDST